MKKLLIILAVTMTVSLGIATLVMVVTGNFTVGTEKIDESKTFNSEEISEIEVNLVSTDLNIIPTSEGEIVVHFHGEVSTNLKRNIPEMVAYKTGDKLYVETLRNRDIVIGINISRTIMDIYIPESRLEEFKINIVSGDIKIQQLAAEKISIGSTSGEVIVNNTTSAEIYIETISGDTKIEQLEAKQIRIGSTSGEIIVNDYTGSIDAGSISGDISLIGGSNNENIDAVTISGEIIVDQDFVSDMNLESKSGDVKVRLPEDSQFYLKIKTVSGDIKNNFSMKISSSGRRELEGIVGDGGGKIIISNISGEVIIDY
ncbi:MAG: DUF4097 domain-containing protein [Actinobacteria bacterium]|nr:DUF4097 domain-containing protein [Actinomycetota bacterium]